jgi:hypothetical protein
MNNAIVAQLQDLANLLEHQNTTSEYKDLRDIKSSFPFWVQEDNGALRLVLSYDLGNDTFSIFVPCVCQIFSGVFAKKRKFKPIIVTVVNEGDRSPSDSIKF